jgi:sec-independent protein translocase protein TatC
MASKRQGQMPLIDHLRELRKRVLSSAIAIVVAFGAGWYFYNSILVALTKPVCDLRSAQTSGAASCGPLYISGVLGPLDLQIKVALMTAVIVSAPFWLYQLWAFIAPALHRKEKRNSFFFVTAATPFFIMGATLGYLILPIAIQALLGFTPDAVSNLVRIDDYLDFVLRIILFVGLAFELPIFLLTFNLIGFLRGRTILKPWRAWIFSICLAVAALSPTGDPLSMALLSVPLILFYFMAGGIALLVDKKRDGRAESIETGSTKIAAPAPITE